MEVPSQAEILSSQFLFLLNNAKQKIFIDVF